MSRVYYKTKMPVHNPAGDGRSDRSSWRSPLDKSSIHAGFRWFLDSDTGLIHDARHHHETVPPNNPAYLTLLANLQLCSDVVPENENDVLSRNNYPAQWAVVAVCRAKGISTSEFEEIIQKAMAAEEAEVKREEEDDMLRNTLLP